MDGCVYRTKDGECDLYSEGGKFHAWCDFENCNEKKPSNADRIRNMSDAELSQFLTRLRHNWFCLPGEDTAPACAAPTCYDCWQKWLQKEAEP